MVNVRKAYFRDIEAFQLRPEDVREAYSLARADGKEALERSFFASSEAYIVEVGNEVICVFGCVPLEKGATFWILFAPAVTGLPISFFRAAKPVIDDILIRYEYIKNYAHQDKVFILKLGKWLNFTIEPARPYGINQEPYHCMYKRREHHVL